MCAFFTQEQPINVSAPSRTGRTKYSRSIPVSPSGRKTMNPQKKPLNMISTGIANHTKSWPLTRSLLYKAALLLVFWGPPASFAQGGSCANATGSAPITITASGTTTVIAARTNQNIHICSVNFSPSATVNVTLTTVGTGAANLTGTYQNIATLF